jgi:hypothetical protein
VSKSIWRRVSKPLAVLLGCIALSGGIALSGCSGEETIPLKKVDFVLDASPKDYNETRPAFARKGSSSKIGHDPSGVSQSK